ncbi:DUF4391 domain-containing protein [Merdimonas faecis]|uniref:DUF4391 domain-containing protein n=1 Tax=Merdimonas faecis TaxID=1653435 RepID=UPI0022DF6956|nr:DUF4391 domain-containing protein [Merdimonas faecis]
MLGLPKSTEMHKQLPKKAIYDKFHMDTAAKNKLDADISKITIVHEISPQTIHIPEGDKVKCIFVLLVSLKQDNFDERNIALLSRLIPQNILLVLEYGGKDKLAVYYKKLMQTEWKVLDEQKFELTGLDLDAVWQNIITSIGGIRIEAGRTLDEQLEMNEKRQKLKREILKYEKLVRKERQPKKKYEYVQKLKKLQEK